MASSRAEAPTAAVPPERAVAPCPEGRGGETQTFGAILWLILLGTLLGFVQTGITGGPDWRWDSIVALVLPARGNVGDPLPSIVAAAHVAAGRSPYQDFSPDGASFIYPPLAAAPYRPLAGLPQEEIARWLFVANRLLLAAILAVLLALARPRSWRGVLGVLAAAVLWYPLTRAVALNQSGLVTTLCLGGAFLAMSRGRHAVTGVFIALSAAIKPPLALLVPLLWWHAPTAVLSAAASAILLGAASIAYAGWPAHVEYLTRILPAVGPGYAFFPNQSWNGLLNRLAHPELAQTFVIVPAGGPAPVVAAVLGLVTLAFCAWQVRRLPRQGPAAGVDALALSWIALTLASPVSWEHHYAPALFALAWSWRTLRDGSRRIDPLAAVLLGAASVLMGTFFSVEGLTSRPALLLASYGFAGGWLVALGWLRAQRVPVPAATRRFPRWLVPLPPRAVRAIEAGALVAAAAVAFYALANTLLFPYGRDQGIYAVIGRTMNEGGAPYRDAWDFKPPGIFFVFALAHALFGPAMHGVRILEAAGFASIPLAFAIFSRRFVGSAGAGIAGGILAIIAWAQLEFWETAQPESAAAVAVAWALAVTGFLADDARRSARRTAALWLALGALYGVAGLMKPTLGGGVLLAPGLLVLFRLQEQGALPRGGRVRWGAWWRAAWRPYTLTALGALAPVAACVGWLAYKGALAPMFEALFVFAPRYTRLGLGEASFPAHLWTALWQSLIRFARHIGFGLALLAAFGALARRERAGIAHVLAATAVPLLGIALQAKFFPYHFATVLVLLSLLAGWGAWKLWSRCRGYAVTAAAVLALALLAPDPRPHGGSFWKRSEYRVYSLGLPPAQRRVALRSLHAAHDAAAADSQAVSDWIAAHSPPAAPILVWGFEPVIYVWSGRPIASRYIHSVPQRAPWSAASRAELMEDLRRSRPAVIVIEDGDRVPTVTGNDLDSLQALRTFPELMSFLAGYRPGPRFGHMLLLIDPAQFRD